MGKRLGIWILLWALLPGVSSAAVIFEFGDIIDGFTTEDYFSSDASTSGFFTLGGTVTGISKFDPSLGTLTDIIIDVSIASPIVGTLDATIDGTQIDELEEFGVDAGPEADFGIYYDTGSSLLSTPFTTGISTFAFCMGGPFEGSCSDTPGVEVDIVFDTASIFGLVDVADFTGAGPVDKLLTLMFYPETVAFDTTNADGEMSVDYGLDGGGGGEIMLTYVYTPIPVPAALWLLVVPLAGLWGLRRT